jgi:hypothetical protein
MGLTIKEIDNAKPNAKLYKLADGGGLCLAVKPNGSKLWWYRYRFDGKETLSIGEYPLVGLKEACDEHFAARKLLDAGTDPMVARRADPKPNKKKPRRNRSVSTSVRHVAREFSVDFSLSHLLGLVG